MKFYAETPKGRFLFRVHTPGHSGRNDFSVLLHVRSCDFEIWTVSPRMPRFIVSYNPHSQSVRADLCLSVAILSVCFSASPFTKSLVGGFWELRLTSKLVRSEITQERREEAWVDYRENGIAGAKARAERPRLFFRWKRPVKEKS